MSHKIDFQIIEQESTFLHPRRGFTPAVESFQVRIDPLTGRTGHISHFGAVKAQRLDLESYAMSPIKGFCPFCIENRDKATPKFTEDVVPQGRLTRNEACLIPNLFPYDIHSGILIMTDEHVVSLERLTEKILGDSFSLGIEFLRRIRALDPALPYHLMTWNYMPPSGGGLVHPHQQYFATSYPGNQFTDELRSSAAFFERYGRNYWAELVEAEEAIGERYIGRTGSCHWLTSFVSFGILGDTIGVFPDVFSIDDFTGGHVRDLVAGLVRVFRYYRDAGVYSFNGSLFFGLQGRHHFSCHFRIAPRTFLNMRDYAPDLNFFQALLSEPVSVVMPEELCGTMKVYF